jgi:UDP-glucose 4-epimerase
VGAHQSGLIGENPRGIPNNLMPFVAQVAIGLRPELAVFGADYPTPDGTGVRDFIHVMDLAQGHVAALRHLEQSSSGLVVNLGTGKGTSVLEIIRAFEKASGRKIPYRMTGRRPGDVAVCFADVQRARQLLKWQATRGIDDMCGDMWRWQQFSHSKADKTETKQAVYRGCSQLPCLSHSGSFYAHGSN